MILPIYTFGQPVLRKVAQDITPDYPELKTLIADMFETLTQADGVGLAAPQITYIMHALKEKGLDVDVTATTVEEARESILDALKKSHSPLLSENKVQTESSETGGKVL